MRGYNGAMREKESSDGEIDTKRFVRVGRYVGERSEATPARISRSIKSGNGRRLILETAKILNQDRGVA